jgi:hypothetical protein
MGEPRGRYVGCRRLVKKVGCNSRFVVTLGALEH